MNIRYCVPHTHWDILSGYASDQPVPATLDELTASSPEELSAFGGCGFLDRHVSAERSWAYASGCTAVNEGFNERPISDIGTYLLDTFMLFLSVLKKA